MRRREQLSSLRSEFLAYARAICEGADEAEDIVHESIVRALTADNVPRSIEQLRPWMFRVIRNLHIDNARKTKVRMEYATDVARFYQESSTVSGDPLQDLLVRQAFDGLSPKHREVLFLVDIMGMRYAEAADVLGAPEGTIMSRVSRARQALLANLDATNVETLPRNRQRKSV